VEHLDVLIVGAGLSGVGAGCHLEAECPWASYAIFEGRGAIGGTWDLFRYPGIRSDSDMFTLGYSFRPWTGDKAIVEVGKTGWTLTIPIVKDGAEWRFDSEAGIDELGAREIGRDELGAIQTLLAIVDAQREYAQMDPMKTGSPVYARRLKSLPGKKDGLYQEGEADNLVPKAFADAAAAIAAESKKVLPYHGYYFRILTSQGPEAEGGARTYVVKGEMIGGFAMIAYPAEYGVSGIKTFIVNHRGVVYEKDLGAATATLAGQVTRFNPDKSWKAVQGE